MVYIGIDVGGTGVQVGVVDKHGHILARTVFPPVWADPTRK